MKKYDVTLIGHYEKTLSIYANTAEQAAEKVKIVLFDTDLIDFSDDDFVCGEVVITNAKENQSGVSETEQENFEDACCRQCPYFCPIYGACRYEDEE